MGTKNEKTSINRRNFLGGVAAVAAGFSVNPEHTRVENYDYKPDNSLYLPPEKPLPVFNVLNFSLVGDGSTMNTKAFQDLIDNCSNNGGGTLFFPSGDFITGTFQIKSNINIYLSPGSTIWGSRNRSDYNKGCLVYAEDAKNISITGTGTINGNGKSFWEVFRKQGMSEDEMSKKMWRPENMMTFIRCNNLLLQNITVANSPAWTIRPIDCERVTINGISILNGIFEEDGPNTDGINPDGCSKVRISDCYLQCGDDCIVLKITDRSQTKQCRDVVVTNCVMITTETGLKIGTETYGEFHNITFSNCVVHDSGGGFGLLMRDGGLIDGMVVSNISIDCARLRNGQGIYIWSHRRTDSTPWGMIKNVIISDIVIAGGGGIFIDGAKERHIEGLTLENIRINITGGRSTRYHENPPHPFTVFGHRVAPYDIFCRYVDDLKLRNIQINWPQTEDANLGHALRCWTVKNLEISGFTGRQSLQSKASAIWLKDVKGAFIHSCKAPEGTGTVLNIDEGTEKVSIIGNEFSRAKALFTLGSGVNAGEVFETANHLPPKS
jgi:hypothetical protein